MSKNQWVVPHDRGWAVRGEGNSRNTAIFTTQAAAVARAKEIAIRQRSEMIVQGRDGKIRSRDSYGNDPFPPRDSEH